MIVESNGVVLAYYVAEIDFIATKR